MRDAQESAPSSGVGGVICPRQSPIPCGTLNAPGAARCRSCGVALPGNRLHLIHGLYAERERLPSVLQAIDAESLRWAEQVATDQGADLAAVHSGAIRHLATLDYASRVLVADLKARGLTTRAGRTRGTFDKLLATLAQWLRYAQLLGLERKARRVGDLSPLEWMNAQDAAPANGNNTGGSDA